VGAKPDFDADTARDAAQIVAGAAHTCLRRSSGRVICKGTPESEKGAGDLPEPAVHIAAGGSETCAVLASGRVTCWGSPSWAAPWSLAKDAVRVSTSGKHACVIRKSGELACWGAHSQGQLGDAAPEQQYAPTIMPSPR
jgi:alpha-tubulin suppressor-like RCC1 family protein